MTEYVPEQGPLPKSTYTLELEALGRKLLKEDFLKVTDSGIAIFGSGKNEVSYNLVEIFKYANLEHVSLTKEDSESYKQNFEKMWLAGRVTVADWRPEAKIEDKIKKIHSNERHLLAPLTAGELTALNVYTKNAYTVINAMLRGDTKLFDNPPNRKEARDLLKAAIVTAVFASSGLARNPAVLDEDQKVYRVEDLHSVHRERISAAEEKGVVSIAGLLSTTMQVGANSGFTYTVKNTISSARGQDISGISANGHEKEFLSLAQQMRVTHYREQDAVHHFHMAQAQDVSRVSYNAMEKFTDATDARKADLIKKGVVDPALLVPQQQEVKATKNAKKFKEMKTEVKEMKTEVKEMKTDAHDKKGKGKENEVSAHDNISPTPNL